MNKSDLEAWTPEEPPKDFAERVVLRATAERFAWRRRRRFAVAAATVAAVAASVAVVVTRGAPATGALRPADRTEVSIGRRAKAVLEPGADLSWRGEDVTQRAGDVFYRVEPGAAFRVHTPEGDVTVLGTCFRVKVRTGDIGKQSEDAMKKRDGFVGIAGAALGAAVAVGVYEGRVRASQGANHVDLVAGDAARMDERGVRRAGDAGSMDDVLAPSADAPLSEANKNLANTVRDLSRRLSALDDEKKGLETQLVKAQSDLATAVKDGKAKPLRNEFDLSPDDWAELAKDGTIKYAVPCFQKEPWKPSAKALDKLGVPPDDAEAIQDAYAKSNKRLWSQIKPLCVQTIGSAEVAEKLGPDTCTHLIVNVAEQDDGGAAQDAMRMVGEIRAGKRPPPGPNDATPPVAKLFLALTGELDSFQGDLAQSFGPEEAHRLAFSPGMCLGRSTFGGPPPPTPQPTQPQ